MSLTVPPELVDQAQAGEIRDEDFIRCIQDSLPYAWSVVERTAGELAADGGPFVVNGDVPPDEQAWGQLFRLVASDAMRAAVERHFNMRLAFQNCCKVGLFRPDATAEYAEFTSARSQILNQKPELLNC
ncbi:SCO5389 family protein [Amycolatopsis aidingensis]|uniref:SCO5389 family protein n=1 Tax=Amycolatopsis aidingensis TaxID=2842453 RepID=UPI001C0D01A4|nr:SCO5389 family protein [Amycolatopsis aidingensis]